MTATLALDPLHWRRHDKAFWVQVLANAADSAAPGILAVEGYEVRDALVFMRLRASRSAKDMRKLLRDDESFSRLRARLSDLGARAEFEIEGEK